jgi:hypothetical protein
VTKPGNSGSEEPKQADAPEATTVDAPTGTSAEPAEAPASPTAEPHESPTGAPGGPPNSTLPEGTDNSGSAASDDHAEPPATTEPAPVAPPKPIAEPKATAEPKSAAEPKPAAEPESAAKPAAKARKARAVDPEPLMAELEKAPPPPREQELRAQAKRRFEEPPPRTLRFSFYFFTAAGLVWLVSMVVSMFYKQTIIDNQIKNNQDPKITPEQITSAINQLLWILIIASLAFTVFLALFGYKATEGTRRARTLVTIFAAIMILFHVLLAPSQLGILSALLAMTGLGLLWSRSSRNYFPPRQYP